MDETGNNSRSKIRNRQTAPVVLSVAASVVQFQINGCSPHEANLVRSLDDAAFALAQITGIYYENDKAHVLRIPDDDLRNGKFEGGATTFKTQDARVYARLSMRRIDVMYALETLQKANSTLSMAQRRQPAAEDESK